MLSPDLRGMAVIALMPGAGIIDSDVVGGDQAGM